MKALGNKASKDKGRPKSSTNMEANKQKSMEYVQDITTCEDVEKIHSNNLSKSEFYSYSINPSHLKSELDSFTQPKQKAKVPVKVLKQKVVSPSKSQKARPKEKILVARSANPTSKLATKDLTGELIKPHSILGSIDDYQMSQNLNTTCDEKAFKDKKKIDVNNESSINQKYDKDSHGLSSTKDDTVHINEENALKNWGKQMNKRQKQQQNLSKQMLVSNEMLLMNQGDQYRSFQEERTLIDRSMPSKDYGKGYRVGSEFWKQTETLGSDECVNITLNRTEKGDVPSVEHVGYPSTIKKEMGSDWKMTHRMKYTHYPWWKSEYLHERQKHLQNVIDELNPHNAILDDLEIIGKSIASGKNNNDDIECDEKIFQEDNEDEDMNVTEDPLAEFDNVINQPVFGPSLLIDGQSARWQEDDTSDDLCIRLLFSSDIGSSGKKSIQIKNDGTTVIHYLWKKLPDYNPFKMKKGRPLKRFFFNISSGVILPGDSIDIPFTFKSPNAGIFTETWELETLPVLCGKGTIQVSLHGVATEYDIFEEDRKKLDKYLIEKQNKVMAKRILLGVLASIKTPERPSTPNDNYVTEDEIFNENNKNLHFKIGSIKKLQEFHKELNPETDWDMSLQTLISNVVSIDEEEEKESAYLKINTDIKELNYSNLTLAPNSKYDACYLILCDTFDKFSAKAQKLGSAFGLKEKELIIKSSESSSKRNKKAEEIANKSKTDTRTSKKDQSAKKTPKEKAKRDTVSSKPVEMEVDTNNEVNESPINNSFYMEKLYMEVYDCLGEMAINLEAVLSN